MEPGPDRPVMTNTGRFTHLLDPVTVMASPFHRAGTGPFPAGRDTQTRDHNPPTRKDLSPVLRGEYPPSRSRNGG